MSRGGPCSRSHEPEMATGGGSPVAAASNGKVRAPLVLGIEVLSTFSSSETSRTFRTSG